MNNTGFWARAERLAQKTPADRNRYVDLLRALSITAVVLGHWILAAPYFAAGSPHMEHLLDIQPWSQWLTWIFQVMPVFFFVGGFSNGVSWDRNQARDGSYPAWLEARLRRLLGPVIPLVCLWALLGIVGHTFGVHPQMIKIGSQVSLVPVWFLAIYFFIVMIVPLTRAAWRRYRYLSIALPVILAVLADWVYFNTQLQWLAWFNYLFVWGAVHQLGYAWQQQKLGNRSMALAIGICGGICLVLLTQFGPYPLSLVGVPGQELSNNTPPKLPLLALAFAQIGLLLSIEGVMRRWLAKPRVWTATVLVNGLIMPIFLWHSTIMMLLIGGLFWLAPALLAGEPGTAFWWGLRPVWVAVYFSLMLAFLPLFIRLEKLAGAQPETRATVSVLIFGAVLICSGLALLAGGGVSGTGLLGLN
ncbi:MAG: acyltransferase, partial [Arenicella sp.]|nr:acyltransferase [Arenicella sp.]